mgnify:CR=1 FL=1
MKQKIRKVIIILFCLYSAFFIIGSTLAPIMAYFKHYNFSALLTSLFLYSCHQQPDRSFWILGYPMALCCRCYGFYLGVIISGIIALFNKLKISLNVFIFIFVLCFIDIIINFSINTIHNTGNITRFIVGVLMGVLFIIGLDYLLKFKRRSKNED